MEQNINYDKLSETDWYKRKKKSAKQRIYRLTHLDKEKIYKRRYYLSNKEEILAKNRAYKASHKDTRDRTEYRKAYYKAHREKLLAYQKAYRLTHRDKLIEYSHKYKKL